MHSVYVCSVRYNIYQLVAMSILCVSMCVCKCSHFRAECISLVCTEDRYVCVSAPSCVTIPVASCKQVGSHGNRSCDT